MTIYIYIYIHEMGQLVVRQVMNQVIPVVVHPHPPQPSSLSGGLIGILI